jgi:hypothetical protein
MVAAFLDSWLTGDPDQDSVNKHGLPTSAVAKVALVEPSTPQARMSATAPPLPAPTLSPLLMASMRAEAAAVRLGGELDEHARP